MKRFLTLIVILGFTCNNLQAQSTFDFTVDLQPVNIPNLPGLHSYAWAEHNGQWLVIGGRKDGVHARQPFNAFPQALNNTDIYVIDVNTLQYWTASLNTLPASIKEQLQSTNMNFYQDDDTLYFAGGYAFSATANDHVTFEALTSINVSGLISAVISSAPITSFFKQITDTIFAVTGGHMGKIGNDFYLVGGHRFEGQYNPMNMPTFVQTYTNQIRKFNIDNSGAQLSFSNLSVITDPVHLRRRDYNLIPQIYPNGDEGYTISSGVFQIGVNLPFLYPVDITASGYTPVTAFNQYLSNYHSAYSCLYDSALNEMHTLFFGGISQYYYQGGNLIQDNNVPFVKTISRLYRSANGTLQEFQLPVEMPSLEGASAELIPNHSLPHYNSGIIKLSAIPDDTILVGHILGGIASPSLNPFTNNQTISTSASNNIYAVRLIRNVPSSVYAIDGRNPYDITVFPNPVKDKLQVSFTLEKPVKVRYFITTAEGKLLKQFKVDETSVGKNLLEISFDEQIASRAIFVTFVFEDKFFVSRKVVVRE